MDYNPARNTLFFPDYELAIDLSNAIAAARASSRVVRVDPRPFSALLDSALEESDQAAPSCVPLSTWSCAEQAIDNQVVAEAQRIHQMNPEIIPNVNSSPSTFTGPGGWDDPCEFVNAYAPNGDLAMADCRVREAESQ